MDHRTVNQPGQYMTTYKIPFIIAHCFSLAATSSSTFKTFKTYGICPFNWDIFQEGDFMQSPVADILLNTVSDDEIPKNIEAKKI